MKRLLQWMGQPLNFFIFLCSLIPIVMVLVLKLNETTLIPIGDVWVSAQPIALKTYDGTLNISDLFVPYYEHRLFFTKLLVAISTLVTHWDPHFETLVLFVLGVLILLMLIDIFYREHWSPVVLVLIPFSLIIFSMRQTANLLLGFDGVWIFVLLFTTATFWVLRRGKVGWRTLIIAAVMALCSSFSVAAGLMTWGAVIVSMWMLGYRKPLYYVFWIAATGVTFFLYYHGVVAETSYRANLSQWPQVIQYALLVIGSPFAIDIQSKIPSTRAVIVAVIGLILFAANVIYLWRKTRNLSGLAIWMGFAAFTLLMAFATGYGRLNFFGIAAAITSRYATLPLLFWCGVVATGATVIWMLSRSNASLASRALPYSNMLFAAIAIFLIIQSGVSEATATQFLVRSFRYQVLDYTMDCLTSGILGTDISCLRRSTNLGVNGNEPAEKWALEMASRRLGVWGEYQIPMPAGFQPDDKVIVLAPFAGQHVDLTLPGSDQKLTNDHILRIMHPDEVATLKSNFDQVGTVITDFGQDSQDQVKTFVQGADHVWFIKASGDDVFAANFETFLHRYFTIVTDPDRNKQVGKFPYPVLELYQRSTTAVDCQPTQPNSNLDLQNTGDFKFNDTVKVATSTAFEQNAYPELTVRLKFTGVKALPATKYSVAFHILDANGKKPQQFDFPIPATDQECQTRFVLFNLPPGDYSVNLIIYTWEDGKRVSLDDVAATSQTEPQLIRQLSQFSIKDSSTK